MLIKNNELPQSFSILHKLNEIGIDGIIIQDLGVYKMLKDYFPNIPIHLSTQMTIHNLAGIKIAERMGIRRVILARELTFNEIEYIRKRAKLELEVFVHGARCYSYSGLCLFSSMIGGRSGNRGLCAQPCRKPYFTEDGKSGHFFSMYDLCALKDIPKLIGIGIDAFKIEGRLKSPIYTAYVTSLYRKAIDGMPIDYTEAENTLKSIFSREMKSLPIEDEVRANPSFPGHLGLFIGEISEVRNGWAGIIINTSLDKYDGLQAVVPGIESPVGFSLREMQADNKNVFSAKRNAKIEIKVPPEVKKGCRLYLCSKRSLQDEYKVLMPKLEEKKKGIELEIEIKAPSPPPSPQGGARIFSVKCGKISKEYTISVQTSKDAGLNKELLMKYFSRLGNTPFYLKDISLTCPPSVFVQPKELNRIRKDFIENIPQKEEPKPEFNAPALKNNPVQKPLLSVKIDNPSYLKTVQGRADKIIFEISGRHEIPASPALTFSMPPVIRERDRGFFANKVDYLFSNNCRHFQISNIGYLDFFDKKDAVLTADYPLYIQNPLSITALNSLGIIHGTLSPELSAEELLKIIPVVKNSADLILYSDLPYFYSDNPAFGKDTGFSNKEKDNFIYINQRPCMVINTKPFSLLNKTADFLHAGHKMFRIDFLRREYTEDMIIQIFDRFFKHSLPTQR